MSHREISIRVDQLEAKPCSYFPAFLNSPEKLRGESRGLRTGLSRRVILLLMVAKLSGGGTAVDQRPVPGRRCASASKQFSLLVTKDSQELCSFSRSCVRLCSITLQEVGGWGEVCHMKYKKKQQS